MNFALRTLALTALATGLAQPLQAQTSDVIDFEGLTPGSVLTEVTSAGGLGPIGMAGVNPLLPAMDAAVVFDSSKRTGDDSDLGTPNQHFGGPGIGAGGEPGSPFENDTPLGNLIIVAEDLVDGDMNGLIDDPDDVDVVGALLAFDFAGLGGVTIDAITIIDVEAVETAAIASMYDADDGLIDSVVLPQVMDNGVDIVDLGSVPGVYRLVVEINGSGAIDNIAFTIPASPCTAEIGDFVWLDLDGDGIQDFGEPGLPGIVIELYDEDGNLLGTTTSDDDGFYLFGGLCAGIYLVCVDESSIPECHEPSPCDQGTSNRIDSECSCYTELLVDDHTGRRSVDFGFVPVGCGGGEGCTPGYWKQSHHFDSWPDEYTPDMPFSDVFEDAFPGKTLVQVLAQGGGGLTALGRHTVAALLNGAKDAVDYPMSDEAVIDMFNGVFPGSKGDYNDVKNIFEDNNEAGCPLN